MQLGFGDLPIYGSPTVYTPYIQRMTKNGLFFTNFYSASPVCSPSRYIQLHDSLADITEHISKAMSIVLCYLVHH